MRRFLTAAVTLGAVTAGVLGVTAPAHAMKRACDDEVANVVVDADAAAPISVDPDALPPEVWGEICGHLSVEGQGQLAQTDKKRHNRVSEHRIGQTHLRPDAQDVVHVYTSQQLTLALTPRVDEAGKPLLDADGQPLPQIASLLGVHMALDEAQQTAISNALKAEQLTYLELHAGATLPTVATGDVNVYDGGSITTVGGGIVGVWSGGTVTTVDGGKVDVNDGGTVTTVNGGPIYAGDDR